MLKTVGINLRHSLIFLPSLEDLMCVVNSLLESIPWNSLVLSQVDHLAVAHTELLFPFGNRLDRLGVALPLMCRDHGAVQDVDVLSSVVGHV